MTTELTVLDVDVGASASTREQFSGAIYAYSPREIALIKRVLELHHRHQNRVTADVLDRAILLIGQITALDDPESLPEPFVGAVRDGGVVLEWTNGSRQLNIAVLPEGTTEFLQWRST